MHLIITINDNKKHLLIIIDDKERSNLRIIANIAYEFVGFSS